MEKYKITIMSSTGHLYSEIVDFPPSYITWTWHIVHSEHGSQSGFILKIERLLDTEEENATG